MSALRGGSAIFNRIVILGPPGSGKSSLALRLSRESGIPAFHTDAYGFGPGWKQTPFPCYREHIRQITAGDRWIIDGNSPRTFDLRFRPADAIIWLDPPLWRCWIRVVARTLCYFGRVRPTVAAGCRDRFSSSLFRKLVRFNAAVSPLIQEAIEAHDVAWKTIVLTRVREANSMRLRDIRQALERSSSLRVAEELQGHNYLATPPATLL